MTIGNNSNKKKKIVVRQKPDPYLRKEWFTVKAPTLFKHNELGQTPVLRTAGLRVSSEVIKGRVYEANLGDLAGNENENGNTKFYFKSFKTDGSESYTDFDGFSLTRHKLQSLFRKRCSKIETVVDATTQDGYKVRVFAIAFTTQSSDARRHNSYCKSSQKRNIRSNIRAKLDQLIGKYNVVDLMKHLADKSIDNSIAKDAVKTKDQENEKHPILLRDVCVHRVKVIQAPKPSEETYKRLYSGSAVDFGTATEAKK